jgi:hypothetical protein
MKHLLSPLLVLATISLASLSLANAQQAKVIKVKGQQAIVQFPPGTPPLVGEMLPVGGSAQTEDGAPRGRGSRGHLLGLSGNVSFKSSKTETGSTSTSSNTTSFGVDGRYGWNEEIFEFGPLATLSYSSTTGQSSRTLGAGGFFDFNLVPNRPGTPIVYGVGATASFGQATQTIANQDTTFSLIDVFAGGNIKWFGLSENVAIRGDAGLDYLRTSGNNSTTTDTAFQIRAGLAFYF